MAEEQRRFQAVDPPLVTTDLTIYQATVVPTTPPGFSSSYSSAYTAKTGLVTDYVNSSLSRPSTPSQTENRSQNSVWKPFQRPGHVVGIPLSYQTSFTVERPSPVRTHVVAKHSNLQIQTVARKLALATAIAPSPSPESQTSLNPYSGLDTSDIPSPALKRKAELAQHFQPVHSFKKIKQGETGPGASKDDTSNTEQAHVAEDAQSEQPALDPEEVAPKPGSLTSAKGGKRNVGGRPQGKAEIKTNQQKGPTRLRTNRPVVVDIPLDVWGLVLPYCSLDFLFKARLINKEFKHRLSYESTWRNTRIKNYGPDMPGPPGGLSEMQYATLLVGTGCMSCSDKKARKTYWAFLRRWCANCLKEKVIMERACLAMKDLHPRIFECIPHAVFDSFHHFETSGTYIIPPLWVRNSQAHMVGYELSTITAKIAEIEEFSRVEPGETPKTDEEIEAWYSPQFDANEQLMLQIQDVECWDNTARLQRCDETKAHRTTRAEYYQEQAKSMVPPLAVEALILIPSYKRAILIPKPPGERSWQILQPKLQEERAAAEQVVHHRKHQQNITDHRMRCINNYRALVDRRARNDTVEQIAVLAVADAVIQSLNATNVFNEISDVDFVHTILRQVYTRYYAEHNTNNYRLLLADAKMVYECKIEPIISGWMDEARSKAARLLKCPGCTRKDVQLRYTFDQLFCHIGKKHAPDFGDFYQLHIPIEEVPGPVPFPWCRLDWPKNLPMLAEHHEATGKWDPEDDSEYQKAPQPKKATSSHGAFSGRSVSCEGGPPFEQFVENVIYAASLLRPTPLNAKFKTHIAFTFALDRHLLAYAEAPKFEIVATLQLALVRGGHYDLFEHFRCYTCCQQVNPAKNNKFFNKGQPFGELIEHYRSCHNHSQWTTHFLKFASHEELWSALSEPEMRASLQIFERLFPMKEEANLDPVLRGGYIPPVAFMG